MAWPPAPAFGRREFRRGLSPSPILLPVAGGGGVLRGCVRFGVRPATGPRFLTAGHHGPSGVAGPAGFARGVVARRSSSVPHGTPTGPAGSPLLRFLFPYSVRWPCRAVRCCRHPDDPAAAFRTAPPPSPPVRHPGQVSSVRDRWRRGPPPLRFSACARRHSRLSPAVTVRAPARPGHAPPLLHGRCSATRASHRTAWPVPPRGGTGGAPGVLPFAALLPPAGVAAFPPLGPTCRFPGASSRRAVAFYVSSSRPGRPSPTRDSGRAPSGSNPAAAPGLRPRGRSVPGWWYCATAAADAALGFASLRSSVVRLLTPVGDTSRLRGRWPLVGFAGVRWTGSVTCGLVRGDSAGHSRLRPPVRCPSHPVPSATLGLTPGRPGVRRRANSLSEVPHRLVLLAPTPSDGPDVLCARRQSGVHSTSEVLSRHELLRRKT